jgi:hypothetical protein
MRNKLWIAGILFLIACNNNDATADNNNAEDTVMTEDVSDLAPPDRLVWVPDFDTVKGEFYLRQQRKLTTDTLAPATMISDLNATWDDIKLVLVKVSNDTLYVSIPDSEYLGQQMGSAGAQSYMASTTYNLTELKGIKYVTYDMQPGDHVSPGTYSRKSFENYR